MIPEYLNKINSDKKALECANILEAVRPSHFERLWLVGFLMYAGYPMPDVLDIIQEHCQWSDYNERVTAYQVATVFHQRPKRTQNHSAPRPRKWSLSPVEILRIKYQRSVALSKQLREENKGGTLSFPHPERLLNHEFNPSADFLRK